MGYRVLSEGERDKYPLVCADEVAVRMEELLRERGSAPLITVATAETREEALEIARGITAERREMRRAEREERRAGVKPAAGAAAGTEPEKEVKNG
jgi:hypothetical protein